jgi:hypothetical protein
MRKLELLMPRDAARAVMAAAAKVPRPVLAGIAAATVLSLVIAAMPGGHQRGDGHVGGAVGRALAGPLTMLSRSNIFRVYLDPAGSDAHDGVAPDRAIRSVARAQQVIAAARPKTDVEVRIKQGLYVAPPVKWSTYVAGHTITFLPVDYQFGEGRSGISGYPIFRGDGSTGFWFKAEPAQGQQGGTRLGFYFLQVEGYSAGGLAFDGGTAVRGRKILGPDSLAITGNTVYGMVFRKLGSKHVHSGGVGYGAIDLVNSRNNVIQGNRFVSLENAGGPRTMALIHGVYLSHYSSGNVISGNHFYGISGDPIRTRNGSGENKIYDNIFERTGSNSFFSDWFADGAEAAQEGGGSECASTGNSFYDNSLISGYRGHLRIWWVSPGDQGYAGQSCGNAGAVRVRTWGNRTRVARTN